MSTRLNFLFCASAMLACVAVPALRGQELPEGHGRDETVKLCSQCHELARSISLRQDRDGWTTTISKMAAFGMKATPKDVNVVLDYLTKTYPAEEVPKVNINTARAIELEAGLSLRRSQAAALVAFREKNGPFKNIDELKKVPALDAAHVDAKKHRIAFQ
ncbi:MAG TPA: helix-hairpin-helix domain-containing protein [Bryobacteraceae bacterium]|nr:helix-hairpin-helix domain-containing protein [Bryobacteraceae bacterium]